MTRKLVAIGNSRGVILDRTTLAKAGLSDDASVEISAEDGRIVIEPTTPSNPFETIRAKLRGADPDLVEAVIQAAAKKARQDTVIRMKRRPRRAPR